MSDAGVVGREWVIRVLVAAADERGAAVIAPPGAGLSTVLRVVAAELQRAGRRVRLVRLPDDRDGVFDVDDELLVIDDAHHGTPAQRRALIDRAVAQPLLLGVRAGAASADLAWLWRSATVARCDLADLDDDAIRTIVERRTDGGIHRATLDGIVDRSAGRPGFAIDGIDSLMLDGRLGTPSGVLRGGLIEQVGSRLVERAGDLLAGLPGGLAAMVEVVAMAGRLPSSTLAPLSVDRPELDRRRLIGAVAARDAEWIQLHPPGLAAAVRATLTPARAVELAKALRIAADSLAAEDRARVLVLAGEPVELDDLAAAARAALRDDHRGEALNLARLAAQHGPRGVMVEAELLAGLGDRGASADRYGGVMVDPSAPDGVRARAAMERSVILMWDLGRPDEAVATAAVLATAAAGTPLDSAAQVHLASLTMYAGRPADALAIVAGLELSGLDGASRVGWVLVDAVASALVDPCRADVAAVDELVDAGIDGTVERGVLVAAAELVRELQGQYGDAAAVVGAARAVRPANETPGSAAWSALAEARAELAVGRHLPARRAAVESAAMFLDVNHPSGARWASGAALFASALAGDRNATREALDSLDRLDDGVPFLDADLLRARAWAAHLLGDSSRAAALLREAADLAAAGAAVTLEAVALHDSFRLLRTPVRTRLVKLARRAPVPSIVLRARHVELAAAGEPTTLLDLAGEFEQVGALLLAAEVAGDAARLARVRGLRGVARTAVGTRSRLAAACGEPATPRLAEHRPLALTARERDVALLAVDGRTSREIAQELAVSVRTVDNLLQRVYLKVGVHSRTELAARLTPARHDRGRALPAQPCPDRALSSTPAPARPSTAERSGALSARRAWIGAALRSRGSRPRPCARSACESCFSWSRWPASRPRWPQCRPRPSRLARGALRLSRSARRAAALWRAALAKLALTRASASSKISALDALRRGPALARPRALASTTWALVSRRCSVTNLLRALRTRACNSTSASSSSSRKRVGCVSATSRRSFSVNDVTVAFATGAPSVSGRSTVRAFGCAECDHTLSASTHSTAPVIVAHGLVKTFGAFKALDGLDLEVRRGEVHGFLGPNGAGKSTTIRALLGLLRIDGGSATVFGLDPWSDTAAIHRRLAYVPGDVALWPNLSGGESVDLLIRMRGADPAGPCSRRDELLERFQLDPAKRGRAYSKGNRQKVALVAALATPVELLILDEPTSGLDPLMEQVFDECIAEHTAAGTTVLLSSHILSEVERLAQRVTIIRGNGHVVETGSLDALRHLRRNHVRAELAGPLPDLTALTGVHDVAVDGRVMTCTVDPDAMAGLLGALTAAEVRTLTSTPPTLEDLFLDVYRSGPDGAAR